MKRILLATGCCVAATLLLGCDAPQPTSQSFSYVRLASVSRADAFDAAARAMGERYHIARRDAAAGVITSVPEESDEVATQGRVGDVLGVPRRVRKVATARVTGSDAGAEVWCKVLIEQYDTEEQRMFAADRSMDDAPTSTAADRDGAATPEQNAVWRKTGRDKREERSILRSVSEFVGRDPNDAGD